MLNKKSVRQLCSLALVTLVVAGCANGGLKEKPVAMPDVLPNSADLSVQWWHVLGNEHAKKAMAQLEPVVVEDTAYVSLASGEIFAIEPNGQVELITTLDTGIATSLAVDAGQFVVANSDGDVSLYSDDFTPLWSTALNALAGNQPLATPERIFVQTIDGRVNALERVTGRLLWVYQDAEPNLTISGTSQPVLINTNAGPAIVTGLANGKLMALNVADGSVIWEYRIARASGKTDVSRLVDVDAKVTLLGAQLIATGYQGDMVVIDTATGQVVQAKKFSSYRSIVVGDEYWYGVSADSHVVALHRSTLDVVWESSDFEYRQLSEMVLSDGVLYVADRQGYMHVVDAQTGDWLSSRHIDWRGSNSNPVAFADGVLLQGHSTRIKQLRYQAN